MGPLPRIKREDVTNEHLIKYVDNELNDKDWKDIDELLLQYHDLAETVKKYRKTRDLLEEVFKPKLPQKSYSPPKALIEKMKLEVDLQRQQQRIKKEEHEAYQTKRIKAQKVEATEIIKELDKKLFNYCMRLSGDPHFSRGLTEKVINQLRIKDFQTYSVKNWIQRFVKNEAIYEKSINKLLSRDTDGRKLEKRITVLASGYSPDHNETFMNEYQKEYFWRKLKKLKKEAISRLILATKNPLMKFWRIIPSGSVHIEDAELSESHVLRNSVGSDYSKDYIDKKINQLTGLELEILLETKNGLSELAFSDHSLVEISTSETGSESKEFYDKQYFQLTLLEPRIEKIDVALGCILDGSYGFSSSSGEPIPIRVLDEDPLYQLG